MTARTGAVIETREQLEALIIQYAEAAAPAVVQERGLRLWILTEDERGDHWAWSWREDDGPSEIEAEEGGTVVPVESLRLPLTALHVPGQEPGATRDDVIERAARVIDDEAITRTNRREVLAAHDDQVRADERERIAQAIEAEAHDIDCPCSHVEGLRDAARITRGGVQ